MPTVAESREDWCWDHLYQMIEGGCLQQESSRDPDTADLAYLIAGLITITQFCLVHRILQGVEHTDQLEWSNSHLFH